MDAEYRNQRKNHRNASERKNKKPFNKRTIGKTKQIKVTTVPAQTNLMKLNQYSMCLASNIFMWIKIIFVFSFGFWTVVALCVDCCSFGPVYCVVRVCTVYCVHLNSKKEHIRWRASTLFLLAPLFSVWSLRSIERNMQQKNSPRIREAWKNKVNFSSAWFGKKAFVFLTD